MVLVPPSASPSDVTLTDRRTRRRWSVRVAPFRLAVTPVTVALCAEVLDRGPVTGSGLLPATDLSWRDAVRLCNSLSVREGLTPVYEVTAVDVEPVTGWVPHSWVAPDDVLVTWDRSADGYRLPTEAEWELACRAGTTGPRYGELDEIAWYRANSGEQPREVGRKAASSWGLHDMLGCVWEWCWDLYDADVYGAYRVLRGGGWFDEEWSCRAGVRRRSHPTARIDDIGLRLARNVPAG
jgi:formylglycine-generating enzyme required for sulfatase activity